MSSITPESTDIMRLLGMGAQELDIPMRLSMFDEVYKYFGKSNSSQARMEILRVLGSQSGKDGLETIWKYVQLQNERRNVMQKILNENEFEPDIESEITQGYISKEKADRVREDIRIRRAKHEAAIDETRFKNLETNLDTVELLNNELSHYG